MKKVIITSLLVAIITVIAGCGGHYVMQTDYQERPEAPGALRVYVEDYNFSDGPGHSLQLNRSVAEGNYATWLRKALSERGAAIVRGKEMAQVVVIIKKVEFNAALVGNTHVVSLLVNDSPYVAEYYRKGKRGPLPLNEESFREMIEGASKQITDYIFNLQKERT